MRTPLSSRLIAGPPGPIVRREVVGALRFPWMWPHGAELERHARAFASPPPPPQPGEVLLLTYAHNLQPAGGLWRLTRRVGHTLTSGTFGPRARASMEQATRLVTRELPLLVHVHALMRRHEWEPQALPGTAPELREAEGVSFGLAFALAAASVMADVRVPADLAATAVLQPDGTLGPVEGLAEKLRAVLDHALGVRRLLVARGQEAQARELAAARLEVLPCARLADALRVAFPDLGAEPPLHWRERAEAGRAAKQLFALALEQSAPLLGWDCVQRAAEHLLALLPQEDAAWPLARLARAIAARHEGRPEPLPWPADAELAAAPLPVRLRMVAHLLQGATDAGAPDLEEMLDRARALVPPLHECETQGLALHGAIGRALARLRRYDEAARHLDATVHAWFDILHPESASHALSELVRVHGVRGDWAALDALAPRIALFREHPGLTPVSRAFVQYALGRARIEQGLAQPVPDVAALTRGLGELADPEVEWDLVPTHLARARCRTQARAQAALGRTAEAEALRAGLDRTDGMKVYGLLADLDAARERGAPVEPALEALAPELRRYPTLAGGAPTPVEQARRVAVEFPY